MLNKFHQAIVKTAYYKGYIKPKYCNKTILLNGLHSCEANMAYKELHKWGYLELLPGYEEMVSLNPCHFKDIRLLLNPRTPVEVKDKPPVEYSYDSEYDIQPFHTAYGAKEIGGRCGLYSYHKNHSDGKIIVYIIVDEEKRGTIKLGSFSDKNSLLSKAVRKIDEKYRAKQFSKADLGSLGKDIEGNRQPPKAIIDMLLYYKYIVCKGNKYYERTEKQLPKTELFDFQNQPCTSIKLTSNNESSSTSGFRLEPSNQTPTSICHSGWWPLQPWIIVQTMI
jgi:hypothetical protein